MPAYLKIEEFQNDSTHSTKKTITDSFMDLSLLALLIAPLALLAVTLHSLGVPSITQEMFFASSSILLIALPKLIQCFRS